ncbi:MAG: polysaccharide deacetylase family protein [Acidobacteriota bacterium]
MNILTLDMEDWCQSAPEVLLASLRGNAPAPEPTARAVSNARRLLDILDEHGIRATCFVLGSMAERFPMLVREIQGAGHEVACHGYRHTPVYALSAGEFRSDLARARDVLEDAAGARVTGYRAPYFSVTPRTYWALEILAESGFDYDSSFFPVHHGYYRVRGRKGAGGMPRFAHSIDYGCGRLLEVPATTLRIAGQNLPAAGGAYLGLLPFRMFRAAVRQSNRRGYPAVFYLHPHDLDAGAMAASGPGTSLPGGIARRGPLRGRRATEARLRLLLERFPFTSIREWMALAQAPVAEGRPKEPAPAVPVY